MRIAGAIGKQVESRILPTQGYLCKYNQTNSPLHLITLHHGGIIRLMLSFQQLEIDNQVMRATSMMPRMGAPSERLQLAVCPRIQMT